MSSVGLLLAYGAAILLPIWLLYVFHAKSWYWHVLSVAAALSIGFTPVPPEWNRPSTDVAIGFAVLFLFVWGIAAPFFRIPHGRRERLV
jgi:hypothetical protein